MIMNGETMTNSAKNIQKKNTLSQIASSFGFVQKINRDDYLEINYSKIGFKCGVEIHQQLNNQKLFCDCQFDNSGQISSEKNVNFIMRNLSLSHSELGTVDRAAEYESKKKKYFLYDPSDVCLVELDEEPPHEINNKALKTALQISGLLNAKPVDVMLFMRKIVLDGSNTSGFQRTALLATNGMIYDSSNNCIRIATICLEEDASQIIERKRSYDKYSLRRLGVPLVEIATEPDIKNPAQLKEVLEQIGLLLRSTNVKRGLGTIRQDLNISLEGGSRVEIKGVQNLRMVTRIAENEVIRQTRFLSLKSEMIRRKIDVSNFPDKMTDISDCFKDSNSKMINSALDSKKGIYAALLPKMKGMIGYEILPEMRFGKDLYHYIKLIVDINGIIHSDELPNYGITKKEVENIYSMLGADINHDAFFFVITDKESSAVCLSRIRDRIDKIKSLGVPPEVRQVINDDKTSYLRPMPGAERMYPETDVPAIDLSSIKVEKPKRITETISDLISLGIDSDLAKTISKRGLGEFVLDVSKLVKHIKPSFIANIVLPKINELKRSSQNFREENINSEFLKELFLKVDLKLVSKQNIDEIILKKGEGKSVDFDEYKMIDEKDIIKDITLIIASQTNTPKGVIIGQIMSKYKGKVDGKRLSELVDEIMQEK